jgi:hypothetical protein
MDSSAFNGMYKWAVAIFFGLAILAPLGVWKAIEIVIWICRHVHVGIQ